ncbi:MAG: CPBP family intramembrane metalloprotease [Corynebacterium sp.]|nr:CPBP family intramembrane metalloprotease [Corynebacterium sp.]
MDEVRRLSIYEIWIVLLITFGMSGLRSLVSLIQAALNPAPLSSQTVTLNAGAIISQLLSAVVLFGWGALALYLLATVNPPAPLPRRSRGWQWLTGCGLAALIGIPGLAFYLGALHFGLSKEVVIASSPLFLVWALANAFGEEVVVVHWFSTRLEQLGWKPWMFILASAVLRGSYHLYQGYSAGLGNIIMGVIFAYFYYKKRSFWPLVIAHALIDTVAFAGYPVLTSIMGTHG